MPKPKKPIARRRTADIYWAELVKRRAHLSPHGALCCERCWSAASPLEAAHIIKRSWANTRCVLDNGWALCHDCHVTVDAAPEQWMALVMQTIGRARLAELRDLAMSGNKVNWDAVATELLRMKKEAA